MQEPSSIEKVAEVDTHIGVAMSGLTADARTLIEHARVETQVPDPAPARPALCPSLHSPSGLSAAPAVYSFWQITPASAQSLQTGHQRALHRGLAVSFAMVMDQGKLSAGRPACQVLLH